MTKPSSAASSGQCCSTASAIEAAALPAPITSVLPEGGVGRCGGRILSGSAAATAAWKLSMSSCLGFIGDLPGSGLQAHHFQHGPEQAAARVAQLIEHGEMIRADIPCPGANHFTVQGMSAR